MLWLAVVLLGQAWVLSFEFFADDTGWWAAGCASVGFFCLAFLQSDGTFIRKLFGLAAFIASFLALGCCFEPFATWVGARWHTIPSMGAALARCLSVAGLTVTSEAGVLWIANEAHQVPVRVSWETLGLPAALATYYAATWILAGQKGASGWKPLVAVALLIGLYVPVRFGILAFLVIQASDPLGLDPANHSLAIQHFASPLRQLISFLPLAVLLARFVGGEVANAPAPARPTWRRSVQWTLGGVPLFFAAACFAMALMWHPEGDMKAGRVVIDEAHNEGWGYATTTLDQQNFGRESVYNFATLASWLGHYYDVTINEHEPISKENLENVDVLLIKTPTIPFADEELSAIHQFVQAGGGLFLIGDHTNLLGTGWNLNAISEPMGIEFQFDASNRLQDGGLHRADTHWFWQHPINAGVGSIDFMTSCTLRVGPDVATPLIAKGIFSDPLDYSSNSFFGDVIPDAGDEFGPFVMCATSDYGSGRVVAFSDSTILSSFGVLVGERPTLWLNILDYLNHESGDRNACRLWLLGACLLIIVTVAVARSQGLGRDWVLLMGPPTVLVAWSLVSFGVGSWAASSPPEPKTAMQTVAIVEDLGGVPLPPPMGGTSVRRSEAFDVFYVWLQRLGYFPQQCDFESALDADAVVLINPQERVSKNLLRKLQEYVSHGGRLLIMDSLLNRDSTANYFAQCFGMGFRLATLPLANEIAAKAAVPRASLEDWGNSAPKPLEFDGFAAEPIAHASRVPHLELLGGISVVQTKSGSSMVNVRSYGAGRVMLLADSIQFSRAGMGDQMELPSADVLDTYEFQFELLENYLMQGASSELVPVLD